MKEGIDKLRDAPELIVPEVPSALNTLTKLKAAISNIHSTLYTRPRKMRARPTFIGNTTARAKSDHEKRKRAKAAKRRNRDGR
jgi:hypothetical protein